MDKLATVQFVKCINSAESLKILSLYHVVEGYISLDNFQYLLATIQVENLEIEQQDLCRMGDVKYYDTQTNADDVKKFICYYKAARKENKSLTWRQYIRARRIYYEDEEDKSSMSYFKDLLTFCARNKITIPESSELYMLYEFVLQDKAETFKNDVQITKEEVYGVFW